MAFDPDAATQALINQMLQEDLQLADGQFSIWDYHPPAASPQPPSYQPSDGDLYGNVSEEWSVQGLDEGDQDEGNDEYDENEGYDEDEGNDENGEEDESDEDDDENEEDEEDEEDDQDDGDDSHIDSLNTTGEVHAAAREMERIVQEREPVAHIYAVANKSSIDQAVRELDYLQPFLNPPPPSSSTTRPSLSQSTTTQHFESSTTQQHIKSTALTAATPQTASSTPPTNLQSRHTPTFHPPHLARPNPTPQAPAYRPNDPHWITGPLPPSLADWNALPGAEVFDFQSLNPSILDDNFPDHGLLVPSLLAMPPPTIAPIMPSPDAIEAAFRKRGSAASAAATNNEAIPYFMDERTNPPANAFAPPLRPHQAPSPFTTSATASSSVPLASIPRPAPPSTHPRRTRAAVRMADRVVEDEMGTFILIPWRDEGREEEWGLETGRWGGAGRRGRGRGTARKEGGVVEVRVGEEETLEEILGGLGVV